MAAATRRYARRQLTWLRKLRDAVIIDVHDRDPEEIASEILRRAWLLARRHAGRGRRERTMKLAKWHGLGNDYLVVEESRPSRRR